MIQAAGASSYSFSSYGASGASAQNAKAERSRGAAAGASELSPEQQRQVDELKSVDRKVRAHEQAHLTVGGDLVLGGANYSYEQGPDGKRYAVAGEVRIDTSEARTPEETIPKAQRIRATALAPVDPSPQDRQVAAQATGMEQQALQEVAAAKAESGTAGPASAGADDEASGRNSFSGALAVALYGAIAGLGGANGATPGTTPGAALNAFA